MDDCTINSLKLIKSDIGVMHEESTTPSHVIIAHKILLVSSYKSDITKYSDFSSTPPPQEFSCGDASVPRSSALKGLML